MQLHQLFKADPGCLRFPLTVIFCRPDSASACASSVVRRATRLFTLAVTPGAEFARWYCQRASCSAAPQQKGWPRCARPIAHDAVMRQGQFTALVVIHGDHLVRRAGKDTFLEDTASSQQAVLHGYVNGTLADVGLPLPRANEGFQPLEFGRTFLWFGR